MSFDAIHFLVVEDHDFQRNTVVRLLTKLGARAVHSAIDGSAALRVIDDPDRPVDIVICDLSMPGMDGMEFIRHLSEADQAVSLILSSALEPQVVASVAHMAQAYRVDLLGVISKPATAQKLTPMISLHETRRRANVPAARMSEAFRPEEISEAWNTNAFDCCLEPRIDMRSKALVAAHAVPSWRHPTRGTLRPAVFKPSLQARGLNDDFVWMMLRKSAAQCAALRQAGLDLKMAVNLDFSSMVGSNMAARVLQTVATENLDPRHLVLGIPETSMTTDVAHSLENLARLRVAGFGLSIEEFGTGHMSLDQLARVAFTELAIHRDFVCNAKRVEPARLGLAIGLDMAKGLGLPAIADGVQSAEDWEFLSQWGCDACQGAFVAPPMPYEDFIQWAASWTQSHPPAAVDSRAAHVALN